MDWYLYLAPIAVVAQLLFVYYAFRNYRYALAKTTRRKETPYRPCTALVVPCKGLDAHFEANIRSLFRQDYDKYRLLFVVESTDDPAYPELCRLKTRLGLSSRAMSVQVLVAGPSRLCSQKIHNLLFAYDQLPADAEVLAFADSDICVRRDWLARLVRPLWRPRCGLTTGYRWFIPTRNNPASLALSAINAAVAQFLGNSPFNQAWGGSMAIRVKDFHRLDIAPLWKRTLSDDLSLSRAVKQAGMRVTFVPECIVASFESTTWRRLCEFGRRQFLITRVYAPVTWWLGLLSSLGSVLGLWGGLALAIYGAATHAEHMLLYVAVPLVFFLGQLTRAVLRQMMVVNILPEQASQLMPAALADVFVCWLWSPIPLMLMLSSALGRTIRWRGIRYRLDSPTATTILPKSDGQ